MKAMSFGAVEILPALLSHEKVQTIRPISKKPMKVPLVGNPDNVFQLEMPPRFKVGDEVQIMWKMRTSPKYSRFCRMCGEQIVPPKKVHPLSHEIMTFPKILGIVKITEVFQIEIGRGIRTDYEERYYARLCCHGGGVYDAADSSLLAWKDGFKNRAEMFKWFDEHYDLSTPKTFEVRRWEWTNQK